MDRHQLAWARHLYEVPRAPEPANAKHTDCPACKIDGVSDSHHEHAKQFYLRQPKQLQHQPRTILVLLFLLGCVSGLINGCIIWTEALLCEIQLKTIVSTHSTSGLRFIYFLMTSVLFGVAAATLCKYMSPYAAGSGLPELKYLLASEVKETEYHRYLCWQVVIAKTFGLILATGSGNDICETYC
jgi:H+/Cl- antiporter ClcA